MTLRRRSGYALPRISSYTMLSLSTNVAHGQAVRQTDGQTDRRHAHSRATRVWHVAV